MARPPNSKSANSGWTLRRTVPPVGGVAGVADGGVARQASRSPAGRLKLSPTRPMARSVWKCWPSKVTMPAASWPRCCRACRPSARQGGRVRHGRRRRRRRIPRGACRRRRDRRGWSACVRAPMRSASASAGAVTAWRCAPRDGRRVGVARLAGAGGTARLSDLVGRPHALRRLAPAAPRPFAPAQRGASRIHAGWQLGRHDGVDHQVGSARRARHPRSHAEAEAEQAVERPER